MQQDIIDMGEIAEVEWDGHGEPQEVAHMAASEEATGKGMEFHVRMEGYTLADMDDLIVHAAARMIVGKQSDTAIAKEIETRCQEMVVTRINAKLETITAEIIDQPITPSWGDKKPITMREAIGLTVREYLQQRVTRDGKPSSSSYDSFGTMLEWIVWQRMSSKFKNEIEKATNASIAEVQREIKARHEAMIAAEKKRLSDALSKLTT